MVIYKYTWFDDQDNGGALYAMSQDRFVSALADLYAHHIHMTELVYGFTRAAERACYGTKGPHQNSKGLYQDSNGDAYTVTVDPVILHGCTVATTNNNS